MLIIHVTLGFLLATGLFTTSPQKIKLVKQLLGLNYLAISNHMNLQIKEKDLLDHISKK